MKRFHIHVSVDDLTKSIGFYSTLFGAKPSRIEADYQVDLVGRFDGKCGVAIGEVYYFQVLYALD